MNIDKQIEEEIYNVDCLKRGGLCFVCDNMFEALQVMQCGYNAIGLLASEGGNAGQIEADMLFAYLEAKKPNCFFAVCLQSNDTINYITGGLETMKYTYQTYLIQNGSFCDMAHDNMAKFESTLANLAQHTQSDLKDELLHKNDCYRLSQFYGEITKGERASVHYPTGMPQLDNLLNGGLTAGLYILGAVSSSGKTTLCVQWADNIANSGKDVLYVSLEMSRDELIARSISRASFLQDENRFGKHGEKSKIAITEEEVFSGKFVNDPAKFENFQAAAVSVNGLMNHRYTYEAQGVPTIQEIKAQLDKFVLVTGEAPVVFVDYLQIMAPPKQDKREAIGELVMQFKQLSRDYNTPVVLISSINRSSYTEDNLKSAFKESGEIEYSADVLLNYQYEMKTSRNETAQKYTAKTGKQVKGFTEKQEADEARKEPRNMQIVITKQRRGVSGDSIPINYFSKYNCLIEAEAEADQQEEGEGDDGTPVVEW